MAVSRRTFLKSVWGAAALGLSPTTHLPILAGTAHAQGKGGGRGNDGGNGSGNSGNAGGNNNGNGNAGGNGKGRGKSSDAASTGAGAPHADKPSPSASFLHSNGMRESVRGGRYEMRDAKGRVIVERRATSADYARLKMPP